MANLNSGLTRQQMLAALQGGLNAVTDAELETALALKADSSDLLAEATSRTEADNLQKAALADIIDSGAKNICQNNLTTIEKNGVTATTNADGSITMSGKSTANSDFLLVYDLFNPSAATSFTSNIPAVKGKTLICPATGNSGIRLQVMEYNSSNDYTSQSNSDSDKTFTLSKNYMVFRLFVKSSADFTTPVVIYPIVCAQAAWNISHAFVPYCPSNKELWAMIQAL